MSTTVIELDIQGMHCASCAARIQQRLNEVVGVEATVNLVTERASATCESGVTAENLIQVVTDIGYHANLHPDNIHDEPAGRGAPEDTPPSTASSPSGGDAEARALLIRSIVCGAVAVPVVLLSMVPSLQFPEWAWLAFLLSGWVVVWGGAPIHRATFSAARHGIVSMDTLITLGTGVAFSWSTVVLIVSTATARFWDTRSTSPFPEQYFFEVAAVVTAVVLLGRALERRATRRAGAAIRALLDSSPTTARVRRANGEVIVPVAQLAVGDRVVALVGERLATDGSVAGGRATLDTAQITGEPVPVDVGPGDTVFGGSLVVDGRVEFDATRVGADTALARMTALVERAQTGKASAQRLADRCAAWFVPVVLGCAGITLLGWLLTEATVSTAVSAAVAVLSIACPCALGLAIPSALLVATGRGAQLGILLRGPQAFEAAAGLTTVFLDKTGTLTTGRLSLTEVVCAADTSEQEVRARTAAVERASNHPIARVLATLDPQPPEATDVAILPGIGAVATVAGTRVIVARPERLADHGCSLPVDLLTAVTRFEAEGSTVVAVGWDGAGRALFVLNDVPAATGAAAVAGLRALGLRPVLVTGDAAGPAAAVASQVGIAEVHAGMLPADKQRLVTDAQARGERVVMVGDGVNDAAALAQADLGMAIGTGTDVAAEAADLTLMRGDPAVAVDALRLARRTLGIVRGNLGWAFGYNVIALPLAAFGVLNPMLSGAFMAASSIGVVANSLRLRRFRSIAPAPALTDKS